MRKVNEGKKIVKIKQKIRFQMKKMKHTKAITTQDFNKICRFCAKPCSELKPIFKSDDYADNTSVDDRSVSVPYLFQNSLNLDVVTDDRLPLFICTRCKKKLTSANSFRQQCLETYRFLIGIYESETKRNFTPDKSQPEDIVYNTPSPPESTYDKTSDDEELATPVIVLIKAESENLNEQSTEDAVKEEEIGSKESETKPKSDPPNQETNETTSSKYKGRGRPRKGQEVKKEKRVPKPHALEMCQICGQLFRCIKTHMFVHDTNPQFECHHCGRKFKHKPNLICHVKNHQNVRKFQCPHCPFKFQYSTNFKRHLRTHTGEKTFTCDICDKKFSRSGGLQRHKLTHDIPRVPCPYCDKMFTTKKGLVNHVGIHTGERPFKCKICGAAFVASSSLCVHSRIHKKENPIIQCKECGLVVTDNVMLTNHMKDHQEISAVR